MSKKWAITELPDPGPRKSQSSIEKMEDQELAELQIESQAVVGELLKTYMSPDKCIDAFFKWVLPQWHEFWGRFQSDQTMSWKDFEQFVQWEKRWQGDTRRVFSLFDQGSAGYISKPFVLETRRKWENSRDQGKGSVERFRWKFANHWGTLGRGWRLGLDNDESGHCPQQQFMRWCHSIGMNRDMKTLWQRLTKGDVSRSIVLRDLDPELDKILKEFVLRLVTLHSTIRQGWCAICRAGGGHLHQEGFEQCCAGLGIDAKGSKMLFAVLDPTQRRYLTEYDKLEFLEIWNPGNQAGSAAAAAAAAAAMAEPSKQADAGKGSPMGNQMGGPDDIPNLPNLGDFEFELVLTTDEYSEYLRRRRGTRIRAGLQGQKIDVGAESKRKVPIGGKKPRPPSAPASARASNRGATSSSDPKVAQADLWHALAPNTLGSGKASLVNAARAQSSSGPSLGRLLSCPSTTG